MFYTNGGETWSDKTNWLNDESHCTWSGITCDLSSHVTEVNLASNNLSGLMPDLSGLSSVTNMYLDFNVMEGPVSNALCNKVSEGTLYLQGDDYICNNESTPVGCCSMTRAGKAIVDAATANFGTANCDYLSAQPDNFDVCEFMGNPANHPLYEDPASISNDITVRSIMSYIACLFLLLII